jgi:NAD(P)-dependent dehydrogenase (short-subunit alcohol dehydrogenase family)
MAVALITGCSSGIGTYTALEMARRGHRVFATMRNLESARFIRADAGKAQLTLEVLQLDVTDQGSVTSAVQQVVKRAGAIDVLVNNAGMGSVGVVEDYTDEEIRTSSKRISSVPCVPPEQYCLSCARDGQARSS